MLLGMAVALYPLVTLLAAMALLLVLWVINKPIRLIYGSLILSSISVSEILKVTISGLDATSIYKLLIIVLMIIALKVYGVETNYIYPLLALVILMVFSYTFSNLHPRLNQLDPLIAFTGLAAPFFILIVKFEKSISERLVKIILILPIISVVMGILFDLLGIHPFMIQEYSGAFRLQGSNIAAHLAMLAYLGFTIGLVELKRQNKNKGYYFFIICINFLILLSTGTRGPLIALSLIIIVYIADNIYGYLKGKVLLIIPLISFLSIIISIIISQWSNFITRTFNDFTPDSGVNISGREIAWKYFFENSKGYELFGQGLGSVLVANDGSLYAGFTVPHNEYIRFYFDGGIIGLLLFIGSFIYVLIKLYIILPKHIKLYYLSLVLGLLIYSMIDNTLSTPQFIIPICFYIIALKSIHSNRESIKTIEKEFYN